ncbi:MAG: PIN domain-containing protein [Archaeoglobaceae archaeon]
MKLTYSDKKIDKIVKKGIMEKLGIDGSCHFLRSINKKCSQFRLRDRKLKLTETYFSQNLGSMEIFQISDGTDLRKIEILEPEIVNKFRNRALEILKDIDPNDAPFLFLAIALNCPIWSNDKDLKKQSLVKVYTTKEILELLKL